MRRIIGLARRAVDKYEMIQSDDVIAVGVSGGKDSLALLCALCELRRFYPVPFTIKAVVLDPCFLNQEEDCSGIERLCQQYGVECIIKRCELYSLIFEIRKEKSPCSMCAKMRRGILHDVAKENGCNKIALGHTRDDVVETFLMNLLSCGTLGCFAPKTYLSRKDITAIRPLIYATERDTESVAVRHNLPVIESRCPVDEKTNREDTKKLVQQLSTKYDSLPEKIVGAMERAGLNGWKTE